MNSTRESQPTPRARPTPRRRIDPERLQHAEELWAAMHPPRRIERELMARWGVKRRQAARYLAIARKRLREASVVSGDDTERRARIEAGMLEAANLARTQGDGDMLSKCLQRLAEFYGLSEPQKIVLTGKDGGPVRIWMPPKEDD